MSSPRSEFSHLSDDRLLAEVQRLASAERYATGALLRSLIELDARRLYLREGCSSLFTYCTQVLRLSEGGAYNRIEVARAARRCPSLLEHLEDGSLTLTTARLIAPHFTQDQQQGVLAAARGKSKREVEQLVASLNPRPLQPPSIRKLPVRQSPCTSEAAVSARAASAPPASSKPSDKSNDVPTAPPVSTGTSRPSVAPLASDRYRIQLTVSAAVRDKLRRAQDLLRHAVPNGDLAEIFDRALAALLDFSSAGGALQQRRCAHPRPRIRRRVMFPRRLDRRSGDAMADSARSSAPAADAEKPGFSSFTT